MPSEAGRLDFVLLRGGTADERPAQEKPYSAASYSAQYGIPVEDALELLERCKTHGEMRQRIYREYLSDPQFREEALSSSSRKLSEEERRDAERFLRHSGKQGEGMRKVSEP